MHGVVCDLSDEDSLKRGYDRALELLGESFTSWLIMLA